MSKLRKAAAAALEAYSLRDYDFGKYMEALRAALAQQDEPQTLNDAMQQPRAMAQTYENGYKAGVAHEREACAQVCEDRFVGDLNREDMEARRCAAAIRARGNT